ncbi:MAG: glycosyltransferase [Ignavibacterium sp.]|nr:glycosyltransferase [Ignavibacterium sp.]
MTENKKFKVLIIAYYFPPLGLSGVQRTFKFVKYMRNYGWEPTVLTTNKVAYYAYDNSLNNELNSLDIRVIRISGKEPNSLLSRFGKLKPPREILRRIFDILSQTFFIPDNKISWSTAAAKKADELLNHEHFDAIFVSSPPFSAFEKISKLRIKYEIPIIIDYRDLWYNSYFSFYISPVHKLLHKKKEYHSLKNADAVVVTNRKIKEFLIKTYPFLTFEDIVIIPHGFDIEDFKNSQRFPKPNGKMIIMFSGTFIGYGTPKYLLKAFKLITKERPDIAQNIEIHFIGYLRKENHKLIKKLKLEEFIIDHGYVDHLTSVGKILSADVLWFMVDYRKNIDAILPGKVYEYIGSKKPIFACVPDGAAKMALQEYGASFICSPNNILEIKEMIYKIYELFRNNNLPVPSDEVVEKYRRDLLTETLIKVFQSKLNV